MQRLLNSGTDWLWRNGAFAGLPPGYYEFDTPLGAEWQLIGPGAGVSTAVSGGLLTYSRSIYTEPSSNLILPVTFADGDSWTSYLDVTANYAGLYAGRSANNTGTNMATESGPGTCYVQNHNSAFEVTSGFGNINGAPAGYHYQRIRRSGDTIYFGISTDGITYTEVSGNMTSTYGGVVDRIGFGIRGGPGALTAGWIRKNYTP